MDEFNRLLTEYKNQYLDFLTTGSPENKTAYQRVMDAIENAITKKRKEVESQKSAMKHFVKSYKQDNDDIAKLVDNAQELHDEYTTSKDRYDAWTSDPNVPKGPVIDVANGYGIMLRFGIFLILIPVLILVGWLGLSGHNAPHGTGSINITQSPFFSPTAIHNR